MGPSGRSIGALGSQSVRNVHLLLRGSAVPRRRVYRDRATLVVLRSGVELKPRPKSEASAAGMALDPQTVTALREHRTRQLQERLAAGEVWTDTGLVFTHELGADAEPQYRDPAFPAGGQGRRAHALPVLHSLRHAYATMLYENGVPMEAISKRLRHAGLGTTSKLYAHLTEKLDRQTAEGGVSYLLGGSSS